MKKTTLLLSLALGLTTLSISAFATPFTFTTTDLPATANIFAAGSGSGSTGSADGTGSLPFLVSFLAGGGSFTLSNVAGTVNCGLFCTNETSGPKNNGADGAAYNNMGAGATNITGPSTGISGVQFAGREMMLVAVFLDANTPSGAGPANFAAYTSLFADSSTVFSPGLAQVFVVGNGLTGGPTDPVGVTQTFNIPTAATRLFLGFADANGFIGAPTMFGDNVGGLSGTVNVTLNPVPEPGTMLLMGLGFAGLALLRKKLA